MYYGKEKSKHHFSITSHFTTFFSIAEGDVLSLQNLLVNIPTFSVKRGDAVSCFQELELALIAQSCLSPGCGTLLLNMMCSPLDGLDLTRADQLVIDYAQGCHMEVYLEAFSSHFLNMTFCQASS